MKLSLNPTDLARIKGKLDKLKFVTTELNNPANPLAEYKFSIMLSYQNAVTRAMGSVQVIDYDNSSKSFARGFHSDVVISLQGLGTEHTTWKNLAPLTIERKRELGYRMKIWESKGDTKNAVRIHTEDGFVGIDSSTPEELRRAVLVEYGGTATQKPNGPVPPRALFTIANHIVMQQKEKILDRIRQIILTYVSWGS
jgi:hypothetical protein